MDDYKQITVCYGGDWKPNYVILSKLGWIPYRLQWAFRQREFDNAKYAEGVARRAIKLWMLDNDALCVFNDRTDKLEYYSR